MVDHFDAVRVVQLVLQTVFGGDREAMAKETGFDASTISRFLRGVRPPSAKFLDRLARLPQVDPKFVRDGVGHPVQGDSAPIAPANSLRIAKAPLPGPPDRFATLLSPESLLVPPDVFSGSAYALRAENALAADRLEIERLFPEDAIVFETDRQALRSILERSPQALKVYALRSGKLWNAVVARKAPDPTRQAKLQGRQIELDGAPRRLRDSAERSPYRVVGVATFVIRNL